MGDYLQISLRYDAPTNSVCITENYPGQPAGISKVEMHGDNVGRLVSDIHSAVAVDNVRCGYHGPITVTQISGFPDRRIARRLPRVLGNRNMVVDPSLEEMVRSRPAAPLTPAYAHSGATYR
ncbi:MAG TPA: hypothetical protein VJB90_02285 [Candidatus Nanoarchaeia archaeon]|nr:hypothetical protein [Candidatus Nanoarchaeia archaeon]